MPITGQWFITGHAVHRYMERVRPKAIFKGLVPPDATYEQALGEMIHWLAIQPPRMVRPWQPSNGDWTPRLMDGRQPDTVDFYRTKLRGVGMRLIVGTDGDRAPQVITVLKG